jgi:tetratricopeptide (TPR) repeat protein
MTGRRAEAGTAVEQVIQRAVDEPGAWERLQRWSVELGDREDPVALARRLTMERPRDGRAWKALASVLTGDEAVDALRRAVELTPRDEYARDALAIALANTGRHDEALEVCEAPILGSRPPLILRGRAAWLEAARGRRDAAIARMRRVLEEAPSYTWGWSQLATWSADAGDHDPAMEAAGWLTRLAPGDASAWAQLGHLQLITGRREDGKATLRRALELDPHHESAGFVLIDALVEDRELDAADALVARLARRGTDEWLAVRVVAIAAARHQRSAAGTAFAELCAIPSVGLAALQAGARALVNENWADLAHEVVRRRAEEASASADVAVAYATSEADRLHPGWDLDVFAAYVRNNPNGGSAAAAFLNRLVERRIPKAGRALQKACRTLFERDVAVWGTYAYLLLEDGRRAEVVAWMKDWQHRDGRQPWMLLNLAVALRGLGDWAAAAAVHRHAERLPGDHTTAEHQAWLALDDALAGRLDEARRRLDACDPEHLNSYYRALRQLVLACLESATDATRGMMLLGVAADTHRMRSEAALTRAYRRCRAVLLRRRGGLVDRLVAWLLDLAATR